MSERTCSLCSGLHMARGLCATHYSRLRRGTVPLTAPIGPRPPEERFLSFVDTTDGGCWLWTGTTDYKGYGQIRINGKSLRAHRVAYKMFVGPIPEGLTIDHLCRVTSCVNPAHLEAVTNRVNLLRGGSVSAVNARKTHCPQGHPYDEANTYVSVSREGIHRKCRTCVIRRARASRARSGSNQ